MRRWKLSPMDVESITRWEDYSRAKDAMFAATDLPGARWVTVESEDKKRSRINVIHDILQRIPWQYVEPQRIEIPKRPAERDTRYERPAREQFLYAEDVATALERTPRSGGKRKAGSKK